MKRLLKSLIVIFSIANIWSCTRDLAELNTDPKNPSSAPAATLFSSGLREFSDALASSNVNLNIFRLLSQQWTETTYTDESRYELGVRNIPQNWWAALYRDVLTDLRASKEQVPAEELNQAVLKNKISCIDITEIYTFYVLVNTYGDIPYEQALDIENPFPVYDDAQEVYNDLLIRIDSVLANISASDEGFGSADLLYQGDMQSWYTFGQSLKLKMGMLIADVDPSRARTVVEAAAQEAFSSNGENASFEYLDGPPNTNPVWVDLVQSGRKDFVAANTFVDRLEALNDPRIPFYLTEDAAGGYSGGKYGESNNYATFSKPSDIVVDPSNPNVLLDYAEVEFLRAEAAARGWDVEGSAQEHYNNAIEASILYWGGNSGQVTTYLANPAVNYNTAAGDWKQKIAIQKWIALYNRGWDAWTEYRRLDYPSLQPPPEAISALPLRFPYPVNEQNLNETNYNQASAAIGGDEVTTKLWWDVL